METPNVSARLQAFVEFITPYAYREDALGDLLEKCDSVRAYIKELLRAEPVWYAGQVRRSFDPTLTVGQFVFLLCSFIGIGVSIRSILAALAGLAALLLCDARAYPDKQSANAAVMAGAMGGLAMMFSEVFFNVAAPSLALSAPEIARAAGLSSLLVSALRVWYRRNERVVIPPTAVGVEGMLIEARRAHRNIWRTNILFFFAWLALGLSNPSTDHDTLMGFIPLALAAASREFRSKRSRLDAKMDSPKSMEELADPRNQLKALGYKLFAGAKSRKADACEFLMFAVMSYPLFTTVASWPRIVTNFAGIGALAVLWIFVRRANQATAAALQEQIQKLTVKV